MPFFGFSMPGMPEILVILLIVLILFGAKRLPELARGLAQSMNEFRKAKEEFDRELTKSTQDLKGLEIKEAPNKEGHRPS